MSGHRSVMLAEALAHLQPEPSGWWADLTVGGGGHTEALLQATAPDGRVLGLDRDAETLTQTRQRLLPQGERLHLIHANYSELAGCAANLGISSFRGMLMDLGVSSFQLDQGDRGFSFQQDAPLDMRMDRSQGVTAAEIVNHTDEKQLADIFYNYGGERRSRQLAHAIVRQRPFTTTLQLAEVARRAVGYSGKIHPATRAFQALRLMVNDELGNLERGLAAAADLLEDDGRLVVISFHSLEDRIVKQFLRAGGWEIVTRHVLRPSEAELSENPRSRSARLRAARRRRQG
jgi:16S rRNA (cytosine1402-N4)-methyltransferase